MNKREFIGGAALCAAAGLWIGGAFAATGEASARESELITLNEQDLRAEVRPGGVNGQPFWNVCSRQFLYAPSFDLKRVAGATRYRFEVRDAAGANHVFTAVEPTASLAPVWSAVPPGPAKITVTGLGADGKAVGKSGERAFHRAAPFRPNSYRPAACDYRTCAKRALEWMFRYPAVLSWKTNTFDKTYQLNCFPSKMVPAVMNAAMLFAEIDPSRKGEALVLAENAAHWLMANSVRSPESMKGLPITYCDYWEETKHLGDLYKSKEIAHDKRDQVMMIYPASVASVFLRFAKATGKPEYSDYARQIGERYLALQRPNGSWPFLLEIGTGREIVRNSAGAAGIIGFMNELSDETGDGRYRAAADRSVGPLEARVKSFDWEGQFEDGEAQRRPYENLTKDIALSTCRYLYARNPSEKSLADLREAMRFSEDQFVIWDVPRLKSWYVPGVIEQYNCEVTIDASYAMLISGYLCLWRAERNPLDLAKARTLGDAITRNQMPDGLIPTVFPYDPKRAGRNWLNCMVATIRTLLDLAAASEK